MKLSAYNQNICGQRGEGSQSLHAFIRQCEKSKKQKKIACSGKQKRKLSCRGTAPTTTVLKKKTVACLPRQRHSPGDDDGMKKKNSCLAEAKRRRRRRYEKKRQKKKIVACRGRGTTPATTTVCATAAMCPSMCTETSTFFFSRQSVTVSETFPSFFGAIFAHKAFTSNFTKHTVFTIRTVKYATL